jgi:tetratricopeptide (TPR) repeat protein
MKSTNSQSKSRADSGLAGRRQPGGFWHSAERRALVIGTILIILSTIIVYLPVYTGKFVWDDDSWTTGILGLLNDTSGLRQMWCQPTALQQYYPLAGTTFWLDYQLWGFWTLPYHLENVLLHASAALLFWQLLRRLQVPGAWLAGAIFALHPVMVESAGWITERKNMLSLVLYLGALLSYLRFAQGVTSGECRGTSGPPMQSSGAASGGNASPATRHPPLFYGLAFILFTAALLSKTTSFSLPAVILLICWWKRGRIRWREDILPTLPFFGVAVGLCLVTAWLEKNHVGAKGPEWVISFPERCLIAGRVLWFYTGKLLWPANLCFIYPRWQLNAGSWWQWLYPVFAAGALLTLWLARTRIGRGPATAVFFFVGTLFPVLGFMNAYFMRFSFVCDHWVYLSSLGLIALAAALVAQTAEQLRTRKVLYGFAVLVLPVLAILTWRQCGMYANMETLWRDTLAKNPGAWMAHYNLGRMLQTSGKMTEAKEHYEQALYFNPDCDEAQNNLAWLLGTLAPAEAGDPARAVTLAQRACELTGNSDANCLDTLAVAYAASGRFTDAIATTQTAIALARSGGQAELVQKMEARLELYRDGLAYRPSSKVMSQNNP